MTQRSAFVLRVRPERHLSQQEVCTRWQDAMAHLLEQRVPDGGPPRLEEVLRLD